MIGLGLKINVSILIHQMDKVIATLDSDGNRLKILIGTPVGTDGQCGADGYILPLEIRVAYCVFHAIRIDDVAEP